MGAEELQKERNVLPRGKQSLAKEAADGKTPNSNGVGGKQQGFYNLTSRNLKKSAAMGKRKKVRARNAPGLD